METAQCVTALWHDGTRELIFEAANFDYASEGRSSGADHGPSLDHKRSLATGLGSARGPRPEIDSGAAAPTRPSAPSAYPVDHLSFGHNTLATLPPVLAVNSQIVNTPRQNGHA